MQVDIDMIMEEEDLTWILREYMRTYKYLSENRAPKTIIIPRIGEVKDVDGTVIPVVFTREPKALEESPFLEGMPVPAVNLTRLEDASKAGKDAAEKVSKAFKIDPNTKPLSEKDKARITEIQSTSLPGSVFNGPGHETGRDETLTAKAIAKDLTEPEDADKLEAEEEAATGKPRKKGSADANS